MCGQQWFKTGIVRLLEPRDVGYQGCCPESAFPMFSCRAWLADRTHSFPLNTPDPPDRIAIIHLPGTGTNLMVREMLPAIVRLGFRAHSGWAALVAVGGSAGSPTAIVRRRIELADPAIAGSVQPFHAAEQLDLKKVEKFIELCTDSINALSAAIIAGCHR